MDKEINNSQSVKPSIEERLALLAELLLEIIMEERIEVKND